MWLENITSTSLELRWEPLSPHDANGWIRSYTIHCTELETERKFEESSTENETEITVRELHPYYTYNCSVAAVTVGRGPFSDPVVNRTLEDGGFSAITVCQYISLSPYPQHHLITLMILLLMKVLQQV